MGGGTLTPPPRFLRGWGPEGGPPPPDHIGKKNFRRLRRHERKCMVQKISAKKRSCMSFCGRFYVKNLHFHLPRFLPSRAPPGSLNGQICTFIVFLGPLHTPNFKIFACGAYNFEKYGPKRQSCCFLGPKIFFRPHARQCSHGGRGYPDPPPLQHEGVPTPPPPPPGPFPTFPDHCSMFIDIVHPHR